MDDIHPLAYNNSCMLIFLVEDNALIRDGIVEYFTVNGLETEGFETIAAAKEALRHRSPDILILDVMLPDGNGFVFAREIRKTSDTPILFLTARENESDRILGFEVGADDYVVKPFSSKELLLRVKALYSRAGKNEPATSNQMRQWALENSTLTLDIAAHKAFFNEEEIHLTTTEWNILLFLGTKANQAVSRSTLLGECLGYLYSGSERTVDTHIANIRNLLGPENWIETIHGVGYRFAGPPSDLDQK